MDIIWDNLYKELKISSRYGSYEITRNKQINNKLNIVTQRNQIQKHL
jgi:hypothetical protein